MINTVIPAFAVTAMDGLLRSQLQQLSRALRGVHKVLIDVETRHFGAVSGPLEHLDLVTKHPQFAWLQKLSGLMVELDERLDDELELDDNAAMAFRLALERLIGPRAAGDADFRQRYLNMLHESPEVTIAHSEVRRVLNQLPAPPMPVEEQTTV